MKSIKLHKNLFDVLKVDFNDIIMVLFTGKRSIQNVKT